MEFIWIFERIIIIAIILKNSQGFPLQCSFYSDRRFPWSRSESSLLFTRLCFRIQCTEAIFMITIGFEGSGKVWFRSSCCEPSCEPSWYSWLVKVEAVYHVCMIIKVTPTMQLQFSSPCVQELRVVSVANTLFISSSCVCEYGWFVWQISVWRVRVYVDPKLEEPCRGSTSVSFHFQNSICFHFDLRLTVKLWNGFLVLVFDEVGFY